MDQYDNAPRAAETPYRTPEPNANIPLYKGRIRLRQGERVVEGAGAVDLRWLPTPVFQFVIPDGGRLDLAPSDCELELPDRRWSGRGAIVSLGKDGVRGFVDRAEGMAGVVEEGSSRLAQLRLHVPNFHETYGRPLSRTNEKGWYGGRWVFDVEPWRLTCDKLDAGIHEALKTAGGYALTHVVACERIDGAPYEPAAAKDLLRFLDVALSFCLGRWTGCALATGYGASGVLSWEQWRLPWIVPHSYEHSWFPQLPPVNTLQAFVPGFMRACEEPAGKKALYSCVHWYVEANAGHGGLEGAIVMALTALELLSWLGLVVRGGDSAKAFGKASAHAKIRQYLLGKAIPLDITPLPELRAFVAKQSCVDGLEAISRIRNRTVHPPKKNFVDYPMPLLEESWRYAVYLLERAILAESGFHGLITERLGWETLTL